MTPWLLVRAHTSSRFPYIVVIAIAVPCTAGPSATHDLNRSVGNKKPSASSSDTVVDEQREIKLVLVSHNRPQGFELRIGDLFKVEGGSSSSQASGLLVSLG